MSNVFSGLVRIGSDPELRFVPSGKGILTFSAASSTGYGDRKKTLWMRVSYWNNPEKMKEFLSKGDLISISGELSMNEYQAQDGTTKSSLELNANIIDLIGKKSSDADSQQSAQTQQAPRSQAAPQSQYNQRPQQQRPVAQSNQDANYPYDDSIPF